MTKKEIRLQGQKELERRATAGETWPQLEELLLTQLRKMKPNSVLSGCQGEIHVPCSALECPRNWRTHAIWRKAWGLEEEY